MSLYSITIREKDEIAHERGAMMGATFMAGTWEAATASEARAKAVSEFLTPLDWRALPPDDQASGYTLERLVEAKRAAFSNGDCEIVCRKLRAKR